MLSEDAATLNWLGALERGETRIPGAARARRSQIFGGGAVPAAPVLSGTFITPQTALCLTAVYAAINRISSDVATLPLGPWRKLRDGGRLFDEDHPYAEMFGVEVNDDVGAFKFDIDSTAHILGWGNSFVEIVREPDGIARELHLLHPAKTVPKRTKSGQLFYQLENDTKLAPENVLHFAGMGFDGLRGYSPITIARQTIGTGMGAEQFGAAFFGNSAVPHGVLKTPKRLKEEAVNNLRRSFNQVHQGSQSAHQVMILEEGMEWTPTQIPPEDAQFLETRQFTVIEIARLYGLPPHKIGDYSQSHLANVEESNLDYLMTTLGFWIALRERELNRKLLTRRDRKKWVIQYDMSFLMRGNMAARVAFYQGLRNMGAINSDEIRSREGMNPIGEEGGGKKYFVQAQYIELPVAGKPPEPKPAPGKPEPEPAPRFILNGHHHE